MPNTPSCWAAHEKENALVWAYPGMHTTRKSFGGEVSSDAANGGDSMEVGGGDGGLAEEGLKELDWREGLFAESELVAVKVTSPSRKVRSCHEPEKI